VYTRSGVSVSCLYENPTKYILYKANIISSSNITCFRHNIAKKCSHGFKQHSLTKRKSALVDFLPSYLYSGSRCYILTRTCMFLLTSFNFYLCFSLTIIHFKNPFNKHIYVLLYMYVYSHPLKFKPLYPYDF